MKTDNESSRPRKSVTQTEDKPKLLSPVEKTNAKNADTSDHNLFLKQLGQGLDWLGRLGHLAIIIGVIAFIIGEDSRRNAELFSAWQTITNAEGQSTSGGRIEALEFLNSRPLRFPFIGWTAEDLYWDKSTQKCTVKRLWGYRFPRQNLSGLSAPNAYLAYRTNMDSTGIKLCGANLSEANLPNANLQEAHLTGAYLIETNLQNANLLAANLEAIYAESIDLKNANLSEANLQNSCLSYSSLQKAKLGSANLQKVKLQESDLEGVSGSPKLDGSDLSWAILNESELINASFKETNLQGAKFIGTNLKDANFEGANLIGANLTNANLEGANLKGAIYNNSKIDFSTNNFLTTFTDGFDPKKAEMVLIKTPEESGEWFTKWLQKYYPEPSCG